MVKQNSVSHRCTAACRQAERSDEGLDIHSMTEDELMALPSSVLDRLLGNIL